MRGISVPLPPPSVTVARQCLLKPFHYGCDRNNVFQKENRRNFFLGFKYKSYWQWHSYQRFTTNAMTSDFLLLIFHGWAVTFPDSHRTVFTFRSWLDLLGVVLAFWISILKISKSLQNYLHRVTDITNFEKHFESFLDHTPKYCWNLVIFRSKNMCQKESLTQYSTVI